MILPSWLHKSDLFTHVSYVIDTNLGLSNAYLALIHIYIEMTNHTLQDLTGSHTLEESTRHKLVKSQTSNALKSLVFNCYPDFRTWGGGVCLKWKGFNKHIVHSEKNNWKKIIFTLLSLDSYPAWYLWDVVGGTCIPKLHSIFESINVQILRQFVCNHPCSNFR